jgi:CRP-like cAMP-binding protein
MGRAKRTATRRPVDVLDWTGARTQRAEYGAGAVIFAQGDAATSVMYVETGVVRLSVVSHAGKEAVVAVLEAGQFFGEGCLVAQSHRIATATAMAPSVILTVEKQEMVRQLHAQPAFADPVLDAHADEEHPHRRGSDRSAVQLQREAARAHAAVARAVW